MENLNESAYQVWQGTLVVLQPTPFCNLDCTYCYLPHRSNLSRMDLATLEKILYEVLFNKELREPLSFVWHAGEPLAIPIGYYEEAFQLIKRINQKAKRNLILSLQTNATPINNYWIELFKKYGVVVGVSIDGPKFIHDKHRITRNGRGTHDKAMRGVRLLQEAQIEISNIMVLTDFALDYPDEIYHFFKDNKFPSVGFNIDEIEGTNVKSTHQSSNSCSRYEKFIWRLLELSKMNNGALRIRELQEVFHSLSFISEDQFDPAVSSSTNQPMRILNFSHDGNYTTFCPELLGTNSEKYSNFQMGNIHKDPIKSLKENPIFQMINKEVQTGVKLCKESCDYWNFCGGGNPANKFFEHNRFDVTETLYCKIHKKVLVETTLRFLEQEVTSPVI